MHADGYVLNVLRGAAPSGSRREKLGIVVDGLTFLYVVSFYTLVNSPELSRVSYVLSILLCTAVVAHKLSAGRIYFPRKFWIPWIFVWYNVCSVLWARDSASALWQAGSIASAVLGATMIWLALESGQSPHVLTFAMIVGSIALVIYSYDEIQRITEVQRVGSIVGNANRMAMYLSYCFLAIWCLPDRLARKLRWVGVMFLVFALAYSGSKKLVIVASALIVFLLIDLLTGKQGQRGRAAYVLLIFTALATAILLWGANFNLASWHGIQSNQVVTRSVDLLNGGTASDREREAMAAEAIELWLSNPILGLGTGQYAERGTFDTYSHNNYTELLANLGLIGLLLYYALPMSLLFECLISRQFVALRWHLFIVICVVLLLDVGMVSVTFKANWTLLALLSYRLGSEAPSGRLASRHQSFLQRTFMEHYHGLRWHLKN